MFTPDTKFRISGVVEGVSVDVRIRASAPEADATGRLPSTKPGVTDVHNTATMLLVAVNAVLSRLQEQAAGIPPADAVAATPQPKAGPARVVDMRAFLDEKGETD